MPFKSLDSELLRFLRCGVESASKNHEHKFSVPDLHCPSSWESFSFARSLASSETPGLEMDAFSPRALSFVSVTLLSYMGLRET